MLLKKSITLLFTVLIGFFVSTGHGQNTGKFDTQISFDGNQRSLSLFVPNDYDSSINYQLMIGLHGLGSNSNNYRNAVIDQLNWGQKFDRTIFVFPDGGDDQNADFHQPEGDEAIINESVAYAKSHYSIDTSRIVLQGFSLGGRSALHYGLKNPNRFLGLLLNTPAIQGILDAKNDSAAGLVYPYERANEVPIYITNGDQDVIYLNTIDSIYEKMVGNDGLVEKNTIDGLGHRIPPFEEMDSAIHFFEQKNLVGEKDLDLVNLESPRRTCEGEVPARALVRNRGNQSIQSFELQYEWAGSQNSYQWNGSLESYQSVEVSLPDIKPSDGNHQLTVKVSSIDGNNDSIQGNNQKRTAFDYASFPASLPVEQFFNKEPFDSGRWVMKPSGSFFKWRLAEEEGYVTTFNTILVFYTFGVEDHFMTPVMDFSETESPALNFDLAYNFHQYELQDTTINLTDTLRVGVSTDCGETFESIFTSGGEALSTFDEPKSPENIQQLPINPSNDNWRTITLDLSEYANNDGVVVRFSNISALGGGMAIDSIQIRQNPDIAVKEENGQPSLAVYPNPTQGAVNIDGGSHKIDGIQLMDINGKEVFNKKLKKPTKNYQFNVDQLPKGVYSIIIKNKDGGLYQDKLFLID